MSTKCRLAMGVLLLLVFTSQYPAAQNCGCSLTTNAFFGSLRHIKWRVETNDATVNIALFEERVESAASVWNNEFNRRSTQASLTKGTNDIRIFVNKDTAAGASFWDPPSKTLVFSGVDWKDPSAANAYLIAVLAHEVGHAFGFNQNSCAGESLMSDTTRGSYRNGFTACDNNNLTQFLGAPPRRDDDSDSYFAVADGGNDCVDTDSAFHPGAPIGCYGGGSEQIDMNCNGQNDWSEANCGEENSPIILDLQGNGFRLTGSESGVRFDLNGDGVREQLPWTASGSDDAWLVLDRNGNGIVDNGTELFGNFALQLPSASRNGFMALALFDQRLVGGNNDGWIDASDGVYAQLQVWTDVNHDGISQANELSGLAEAGVNRISLEYRESRRQDRWGNVFRYQSKVVGPASPLAYDVFLGAARQQ
jgi:hypothetical protein